MISAVLYEQCVRLHEWCTGIQVLGVGTSLKVTIQRSSESRAFSTGSEEAAAATTGNDKDKNMTADKYCCYICNVTSPDQQARLDPVKEKWLSLIFSLKQSSGC